MDETHGTYVDDGCFVIHDYHDDTDHDTNDDTDDDTDDGTNDDTDDDTDDGGRGNREIPVPAGGYGNSPGNSLSVRGAKLAAIATRNTTFCFTTTRGPEGVGGS